jgi:hypothetical protein
VQWHQWHAISGVTWRKPNVSYFSYGWLAGVIANQRCLANENNVWLAY